MNDVKDFMLMLAKNSPFVLSYAFIIGGVLKAFPDISWLAMIGVGLGIGIFGVFLGFKMK